MKTKRACNPAWIVALAASILVLMTPVGAGAAFTITFAQVGNDVVATGTGSLNITGLSYQGGTVGSGNVLPSVGALTIGRDFADSLRAYFTPATVFGTGTTSYAASSNTGYVFGLLVSESLLYVSSAYQSGTTLTSSSTFQNTTIAGLGLTSGTYSYGYSATQGGATLDRLNIQVNSGAVPEPSSALMCVMAGFTGLAIRSLRRRAR